MNALLIILGAGALGIALIAMLGATFFTVEQRTIAIVERLRKYTR
jgi:regulator of protease activity HflC (stomatin/prohibitin superfamily)